MRQFKYEIGQMVYYKNMPNEIVNRYYDKTQESNAYDLVCRLNGHSKEPRVYIEIKEDAILDARPKFPRKKKKNQEQNFNEGNTQQDNGQTLIQSFISSDLLKKLEVIINHHYYQIMPKIKNDGSMEFVNYPTRPEIMFDNTSNLINKQKDSFVKKYKSRIMKMRLYSYISVEGNIDNVKKHLEEFARIRETKSFRFHVEIKTHTKCKIIRVK
jgi:hypothetical protein